MSRPSEDSDYVNSSRGHLHAGWLQYKSTQKQWASAWAVLKDDIIFLFQSEITSLENHTGTLRLEQNSSVQYKDDKKHACRFELHSPSKKINSFKVATQYEREQWRAYLTAMLTGSVNGDFVLSPPELKEIQRKVNQSRKQAVNSPLPAVPSTQGDTYNRSLSSSSLYRPSGSVISRRSDSSGSTGSAEFDPPVTNLNPSDFSRPRWSLGDSGDSVEPSSGGPFMRHKFYLDGRTDTPSWFFSKCSPELAEKILKNNPEQGNTLMRLSSRDIISGTYAISKCMKRTGEVLHYEVIRVAEGYKIKVQNEHLPMKCLSEVMNFFQKMSGESTTFPLKTNNLQELGIAEPHYADFIRPPSVCQLNKNSSTTSSSDQEVLYEEPVLVTGTTSRSSVGLSMPLPPPPVPVNCSPSRSSLNTSAQFPLPPPPLIPTGEMERLSISQVNKTWSSRKNELTNAGPNLVRTLSGVKHSRPSELRPLSDIQQQIQTESVLNDFDAQLDKASCDNLPPPLPEIPKDRPKLNQPVYANENQTIQGPGNSHPRYSQRSMSIPNVPLISSNLDSKVLASFNAPFMVSPEAKKIPASSLGNSLRAGQLLNMGLSLDECSGDAPTGQGGPFQPANRDMQDELKKKLEARKKKVEGSTDSESPDNDKIYANLD